MNLQFVTDLPQEIFAPRDVFWPFDTFALAAVDHTENAAPLVRFGDDDFDRVRRGAKDAANFRHHLESVEYVDGKESWSEEKDKAMPG